MKKINFKNGTLLSKAKVTINGTIYEVEPEEYEGETPLSAEILNEAQNNIENSINGKKILVTTSNISQNTNYTVPQKYCVGKGELWVFFEGILLSEDEHYVEVGTKGEESTVIQFKDWDVPAGYNLEFIYR